MTSPDTRQQARLGHLAMLAFSMLVAGSFSLGVQIANEITPAAVTAFRFVVSFFVIGSAAWALVGFRRSYLDAPWRYLILGGLFGSYFVLMFEGLKTAPPVSAAAVFTLTPLIAAFAGFFLLGQITTRSMRYALIVGAIGALLVIFRADLSRALALDVGRGEAIYFVGCVAHAIYAPMIKKLNRGEPVLAFTTGMLAGGALLLIAYAWSDLRMTDWAGLSAKNWAILAYLSLGASSMTFVLLQFASMRLKAAKVMAYTYLTPSWVLIWEAALGNGLPPALILVGVALTVVALVILFRGED